MCSFKVLSNFGGGVGCLTSVQISGALKEHALEGLALFAIGPPAGCLALLWVDWFLSRVA